jgi:hypothetical protein
MATTEQGERPKRSGAVGFAWGVYQQVSAVLGAIALAALVSHLFGVEWRNTLGRWSATDSYVRPAMGVYLLRCALSWFGWRRDPVGIS